MIPVERFSTLSPTNSEHAYRVPDLLRRCSSAWLDRLSLSVGWCHRDAASLMAESAGWASGSLSVLLFGKSLQQRRRQHNRLWAVFKFASKRALKCRSDPKCEMDQGWRHWKHARLKSIAHEKCRRWSAWLAVGLTIRDGFLSCFLNPRDNVTNQFWRFPYDVRSSQQLVCNYITCENLYLEILP